MGFYELLLGNQIFNCSTLITLQLGIQTLGICFFLYLQLIFELLVFGLSIYCLIGELIPLLIQESY